MEVKEQQPRRFFRSIRDEITGGHVVWILVI